MYVISIVKSFTKDSNPPALLDPNLINYWGKQEANDNYGQHSSILAVFHMHSLFLGWLVNTYFTFSSTSLIYTEKFLPHKQCILGRKHKGNFAKL